MFKMEVPEKRHTERESAASALREEMQRGFLPAGTGDDQAVQARVVTARRCCLSKSAQRMIARCHNGAGIRAEYGRWLRA
jgi:hypothetical protein